MQGQPGQAVVAHRVTAEQQAGDLVALEGEDVLTNSALQHLKKGRTPSGNIFPRCRKQLLLVSPPTH